MFDGDAGGVGDSVGAGASDDLSVRGGGEEREGSEREAWQGIQGGLRGRGARVAQGSADEGGREDWGRVGSREKPTRRVAMRGFVCSLRSAGRVSFRKEL